MDLYYEAAASQSAGTHQRPQGTYLTAYLDDEQGAGQRSTMLILMADGTGGHVGGPIAANLVVSTCNRNFVRRIGQSTPPESLRACVQEANAALAEAIRETPTLGGMACTLVGLALMRNRLHWISIGDSHLALIRDGKLQRLNEDHSYGGYLARLRAQGVEAEPEPGLTADMLMSVMNGAELEEIDCPEQGLELRDGDRLIVVSQGIAMAGEAQLLSAGSPDTRAEEAVAALLRVTPAEGVERRDEATAIVVDVIDRAPREVGADGEQHASQDAAPDPVRAARLAARRRADIAAAIGAVCIFTAAALGTWYALDFVKQWRQASAVEPGPPRPVAAISAPALPPVGGGEPATGTGIGTGTGTGLTFGAPPAPSLPDAGSTPGAPAAGESSLSFGAPAPAPVPGAAAPPPESVTAPPQAGFRDPLSAGGEGPLMLPIPGGQFQMGSAGVSPRAEERPRREVSVAAFALGKYEVTVAQYQQFARATGRNMPDLDTYDRDRTPISRVTWEDAYAYTVWLSRETGQRYRLPSEAEWEYAASAGSPSAFWWGNEVGEERAHCFDCGTGLDPRRATQVGRFAANPFGLHDTAGNVAEWVHECWHPNYRNAPNDASVWEGGDCSLRVVRGGGFDSPSQSLRPRARVGLPATQPRASVGFRVARDL